MTQHPSKGPFISSSAGCLEPRSRGLSDGGSVDMALDSKSSFHQPGYMSFRQRTFQHSRDKIKSTNMAAACLDSPRTVEMIVKTLKSLVKRLQHGMSLKSESAKSSRGKTSRTHVAPTEEYTSRNPYYPRLPLQRLEMRWICQ